MKKRLAVLAAVFSLAAPGLVSADPISFEPHHDEPGHSPSTHYFAETGDEHHFAWLDQDLSTSVIDIYYDFRGIGAFANVITAPQVTLAEQALDLWANAANLNFVRNTLAVAADIINIGTADLAALGFASGPGGILGLGGGVFTHDATHSITGGVAWMDFAETWDETIGNEPPAASFDWFTVSVQEIGHALGLGHTDDLLGPHMMDGFYGGYQTTLSANDVEHIASIYGATQVPEPGSLLLFGAGVVALLINRRRYGV